MQATLTGLAIVLPIVVAYLALFRWADRFEPEPLWVLGAAFAWGAIVAAGASYVGIAIAETRLALALRLPSTNPVVLAMSDAAVAPLLEEAFKAAGLVLLVVGARRLGEVEGPLDGLVLGGVIGLGFTLTEDVLYVRRELGAGGFGAAISTTFLRTVLLGLGHATYTAMTGLGFGIAAELRGRAGKLGWPAAGFVAAVCLHALHNVLGGLGPTYLFATVMFTWSVDVAFVALVVMLVARERRILRRELAPEVGGLIEAIELEAITSYFALDRQLAGTLLRNGLRAYLDRSERQQALVKLGVAKHRRRIAPEDAALAQRESALREAIARLNQRGVRLAT